MSHVEDERACGGTKIALMRRAIELNPRSRKLMLAYADALAERGEYDEYARIFEFAYRMKSASHPMRYVSAPDARTLRNKAQGLIERGVNYSPVIAALALGSAMLGECATVKLLIDYRRLFSLVLAVRPKEFSDGDYFVALAAEVRSGLQFYDTPDNAIHKAWRHNDILNADGPACRALATEIRAQVDRYIANLPPETSHPFLASRPEKFRIKAWAVVSGGESHHRPHIHPRAWASGVYYVICPEISREKNSHRGWLRVGPPAEYGISEDDGWPTRMVAPEPGTLVLMPAYFYHDTSPMGVDQERICIAFDIIPSDLGRTKSVRTSSERFDTANN